MPTDIDKKKATSLSRRFLYILLKKSLKMQDFAYTFGIFYYY